MALGLIESDREPEPEQKEIETPRDVKIVTFDDLFIRTKDSPPRIIQFVPNPVQRKYLAQICPNWERYDYRMQGLKEIILKARQEGFSTLIAALFFIDTINTPYTRSVVLAHDADTSIRLFGMIQRFYDYLPPEKKRPLKYSNRRELVFEDIDSSYFVGTAGNVNFGRSDTINNVHGSEAAFYPNAGELWTGLEESVPENGNIFKETTANGLGNDFHEEWVDAENGNSTFTTRFYAWFEFPDYSLPAPPEFKPNKEESALQVAHNLSLDQVYWWHRKKKQKKKKMAQEYPSTSAEAFIASGNPYFDRDRLTEILQGLAANPELGPIEIEIPEQYKLLRKHRDKIEFYRAPQQGRTYTIGADVAEGVDDRKQPDHCSADVLDNTTWEQVCHVHGNWEPYEYACLLDELGRFYNDALLVIERNNHGHSVLNTLINQVFYPNLYYHESYDEYKKESVKKPGWLTDLKHKPLSLDNLETGISERGVHIRSRGTVSELMTFVHLPGGKSGGEGNSKDDRVMSLAITCIVAINSKPPKELEFSW